MTNATIALTELAEKGADVDVLRQMVQFMAQRLMEIDVEGRCGAGYDENAYFSPSWTAFQADRGRAFSVIVDGVSG